MSGTIGVTLAGGQVTDLFLVLLRATGLVIAAPLFGHRAVPLPVKAGLAVALTLAVARTATAAQAPLPVLLAAPLELAIGLAIGFVLSLGFYAIELAGQLVSLQMGLSLGAVMSPTQSEASTPLDPFFSLLAGLLFLALGLHLAVVQTFAQSFTTYPLGGGWPANLWAVGAQTTALVLELGTRVALPLALVLLLTELAVALLARAIPQINVFILGLPLKILVGLAVLTMGLPTLMAGAESIYRYLFQAALGQGVLP